MEKLLEMVWMGPQVEWGRVSGNHQGGANSVSQVDGVSNMVPKYALWLYMGRTHKRSNGPCQQIYLEKAIPQLLP